MFRVFASSGGSKTLSDDHQRAAFPGESSHGEGSIRHVRIAIVGAGFSGLGMAIRLKQSGQRDFVVIEKAADAGGTWRDNTYPGCACDIPSHLYSFSFALNPHSTQAHSPQLDICDYPHPYAQLFAI